MLVLDQSDQRSAVQNHIAKIP